MRGGAPEANLRGGAQEASPRRTSGGAGEANPRNSTGGASEANLTDNELSSADEGQPQQHKNPSEVTRLIEAEQESLVPAQPPVNRLTSARGDHKVSAAAGRALDAWRTYNEESRAFKKGIKSDLYSYIEAVERGPRKAIMKELYLEPLRNEEMIADRLEKIAEFLEEDTD